MPKGKKKEGFCLILFLFHTCTFLTTCLLAAMSKHMTLTLMNLPDIIQLLLRFYLLYLKLVLVFPKHRQFVYILPSQWTVKSTSVVNVCFILPAISFLNFSSFSLESWSTYGYLVNVFF